MSGPAQPDYLLVGEILRPHGVKGELKVRVLTDYPERIPLVPALYLAQNPNARTVREVHVESMRMHQGFALIQFREAPDRTQAERLRGLFLMVRVEDAVPLEEGEFYLFQVVGLNVVTEDGQFLGQVAEILQTGANDVYVVSGGDAGEFLLPVTPETVLRTDVPGQTLTVRLPEGLIGSPVTDEDPD